MFGVGVGIADGGWGASQRLCALDWLQRGKVSGKEILKSLRMNAEVSVPPLPHHAHFAPSFSSPNDDQNQVKGPRAGGSVSRELLLEPRAPALSCAHSQAHFTCTLLAPPEAGQRLLHLSFSPRETDRQQHE